MSGSGGGSSAAASIEEFIELLGAEQHVDLPKLRDYARHGVRAAVRGEVWLYLLGVLSDDKSQEMTSVRSKYIEYDGLNKHSMQYEKRIRNEAVRYYQRKLIPRPPPGRTLARSSQRIAMQQNQRTRFMAARGSQGMGGGSSSGGGGGHVRAAGSSTSNAAGSSSSSSSGGSTLNDTRGSINGNKNAVTNGADSNASLAQSSASALSSTDAASIAAAATMRGPNRVDNGQTHILAGIMGDSSSGPTNLLHPSESDDVLLIDPEAAATNEMKRFCQAVENIVSAHLNRWRWRSIGDGNVTTVTPQKVDVNGQHGSPIARRQKSDANVRQSAKTGPLLTVPHTSGDGDTLTRRLSSSSSSSSVSSVSSVDDEELKASVAVDDAEYVASSAFSPSPFPSLPKEYEWAHQAIDEHDIIDNVSAMRQAPNGHYVRPDYQPDLILLCSPFVKCIRTEAGMFFAFEKLMAIIGEYDEQHPLPSRIASFLTLFRTTLPDLYAYFDEEEVDVIGLASAWMRHLLAAEMRIEDLMRLWDTYFAVPDPLDLHMYVCIAILTHCKDALEELDQSEAKSMLFTLPPLDVDRIINEAINIRLSHRQSEMLSHAED